MNKSENVKKWRKITKERMVKSFNNECCICKKEYPSEVFDFHHLNPKEKLFSMGAIRANCISWKRIVKELRKCIMVCSNCHRLIHYNNAEIPENPTLFNEDFVDYKIKKIMIDKCPICGKDKLITNKTCSLSCGAKIRYNVDWDKIDIMKIYKKHGTYVGTAKELNVSDHCVRTRILKLKKELML